MNKTTLEAATRAATTAADAAIALAKATSDTASALASAKAAADVTAAVLATDISYIKKDLAEIKLSLDRMPDSFLTKADFKDHSVMDDDHEKRIRLIEQSMWKWVGASSVITTVVTISISFALKLI